MNLPVDYTKLSWQERRKARETYVELQKGLCYWCKKPLNKRPQMNLTINWSLFPPKFLEYPVHLQHNHNTGMTEGAVHSYCNAVMWQYYGR